MEHRSTGKLRNASHVGAMLSCDPHTSRDALLQEYAIALSRDPSAYQQRKVFEPGHRFEALARPEAEKVIGEELYARVFTRGILGASLDGVTLGRDTNWEHKRLNDELREALPHKGKEAAEKNDARRLPKRHRGQMEQQLLVDGAERCLFSSTEWELNQLTGEWELKDERYCWYQSDPALRDELLRGWAQFDEDLAEYKVQPAVMKAVAAPVEDLPVLVMRLEGRVTESNLEMWRDAMMARIRAINRDLKTDEDFATAKAMVTKLEDGKKALMLLKDQALAQASQILEQFKAIDAVAGTMDETRKALDTLVKEREAAIRGEIMDEGVQALRKYLGRLNDRLADLAGGAHVMPDMTHPKIAADFARAIKSKRTVKTLREAVNAELARAKIAASTLADNLEANLKVLGANVEHRMLFADWRQLIFKDPEDCAIAVRTRVAEHKAEQERKRLEAERQQQLTAQQQVDQAAGKQQAPAGARYGSVVDVVARPAAVVPLRNPLPQPSAATPAYLTLADVNARLAPLSVTAEGLSEFGIDAGGESEDREPLYPAALLLTIVDVLTGHLAHVRESLTLSRRGVTA
jgi:predicted phage-related endonuclease